MDFWDERYSSDEYAYGTRPNEYFKLQIDKHTPGKLLIPAEGEGRNAVYAALKGWEVTAFDQSCVARKKAIALAEKHRVNIYYLQSGYDEISLPLDYYDGLALIFAHAPKAKRTLWHYKLSGFLKKNGILIMEAFAKDQIKYASGGPKDPDMLYTIGDIKSDFRSFSTLDTYKEVVMLDEGRYHKGKASVIRVLGKK